jgi:hypothetical protein
MDTFTIKGANDTTYKVVNDTIDLSSILLF